MEEEDVILNKNGNTRIFLELYEYINAFYPIGLNFNSDVYQMHPKFAKYKKLMQHKSTVKHQRWEDFKLILEKAMIPYKIDVTKFPKSYPSYGIHVKVNEIQMKKINFTQNFYVLHSLMAPCYTMYGIDTVSLDEKNGRRSHFNNKVTIEPVNEYESLFIKVSEIAQEYLPKSSYVSVSKLMYVIRGLELPYLANVGKVNFFQALFGRQLFKQEVDNIGKDIRG